jgi:CheY-like chemotaxis protein
MNLQELKKTSSLLTVLYAEDEEDVRVNMVSILEMFFKKVIVAKDGKEAIEKFKSNSVDMIITDVRMPYVDGLEFANYVKNIDRNIPIIIATAHNDIEYFISSIKIGITNYLLKPITQNDTILALSEAISILVDRKKSQKYDTLIAQESGISDKKNLLGDIVNIYNVPTIVINDDEPFFMNNAFIKEFEFFEHIMNSVVRIEKFVTQKEGYAKSLKDVDKYRNKIILNNKEYIVNKKNLFIGIDIELFTFEVQKGF